MLISLLLKARATLTGLLPHHTCLEICRISDANRFRWNNTRILDFGLQHTSLNTTQLNTVMQYKSAWVVKIESHPPSPSPNPSFHAVALRLTFSLSTFPQS